MTGNVLNRPLIRSVAVAASITGTIQAIIWTSLSVVSILFYFDVITVDKNVASFNYQNIIYDTFLNADNTNENVIVTPTVFSGFMYAYAISSFGWLLLSLYMLWAMKRNKWKGSSTIIGSWATLTILISILDVVLIGLVAADYVTNQDLPGQSDSSTPTPIITSPEPTDVPIDASTTDLFTSTDSSTDVPTTTELPLTPESAVKSIFDVLQNDVTAFEAGGEDKMLRQIVNTSYIIVITLAARGYILWIINVIFAIILMKFAITLSRSKTPSLLPMIDGYSTGRTPWNNLYEQTDISNGFSNRGFVDDDNDKIVFRRSDSFVTAEPDGMNRNPLSNGNNPYAQQIEKLRPVSTNPNIVSPKVAKIGKKNGSRTPPRNVPPPNIPRYNSPPIPDPDYTPPGSPIKPKSVLRPRSNYVL